MTMTVDQKPSICSGNYVRSNGPWRGLTTEHGSWQNGDDRRGYERLLDLRSGWTRRSAFQLETGRDCPERLGTSEIVPVLRSELAELNVLFKALCHRP
jgi:hypothetical protein